MGTVGNQTSQITHWQQLYSTRSKTEWLFTISLVAKYVINMEYFKIIMAMLKLVLNMLTIIIMKLTRSKFLGKTPS